MSGITRRQVIGGASGAALGLPFWPGSADGEPRKAKVIVAGAHPDDPESGCGGTAALYSDLGCEVVLLYLTRGEAGIPGKSAQEAAAIRTAECQKACAILKARPLFAGQIDGDTEVSKARYAEFRKVLAAERPDIVFTHWPIDTHRDHRAISLLVYDAWLESVRRFELYYFEVEQGEQTQQFHPTHYVDIASSERRKRAACYAHASQKPETDFYPLHEKMHQFRGLERGCQLAEAFVRHAQSPGGQPVSLPGTSSDRGAR